MRWLHVADASYQDGGPETEAERVAFWCSHGHPPAARKLTSGLTDSDVPARLGPSGDRASARRLLDSLSAPQSTRRDRQPHGSTPGFLPLGVQLTMAFEARGLRCERAVGVSGFPVPVAVCTPGETKQLRLALHTNEGTETAGAFEDHVHRPRVLSQRGWRVLRVTAPEWHRARGQLLTRIERLVRT